MKTSRSRIVAGVIVCILVAAGIARAQSTGTGILGRVTDSSGAAGGAAKVTATDVATGQVQSQLTNQDGENTFPLVEIGMPTVRGEQEGFVARRVPGLRGATQQRGR